MIPQKIYRFRTSTSGVAAIEFALCAPFLFLLFVGGFSIYDSVRGVRQVTNSMSTVAELASRRIDMDNTERDALFATANALLGTSASNVDMDISITSIVNMSDAPDNINYNVTWSEGTSNTVEVSNADIPSYELPNLLPGESVILVVAEAKVMPILSVRQFGASLDINRYALRKPRFVSEVLYN